MIQPRTLRTLWLHCQLHLPGRTFKSYYSNFEGIFGLPSYQGSRKDAAGVNFKTRNTMHPLVPVGDESCARLIATIGEKRKFAFNPKTVVELGENLEMLRTKNVGHTTGPRTYYFKDILAQLEQAIVQYTCRFLTDKGFKLLSVPDLIHPSVIEGCGFNTSGERTQVYKLKSSHGQVCLAGTGEIPIAGFLVNSSWSEDELPQRFMTVSRCYRAETSDLDEEKGIYRVHQFTKVEMFGVTKGDDEDGTANSQDMMDEFLVIQKTIFQSLGLHFRMLDMPSEELGAPAHRKYDIEALMPAKNNWGEISSTSNCTDFQSERLNIRYKQRNGQTKYCHTVNGTAAAVPRLIMAIVESHQKEDGTFSIPPVLHPYMEPETFHHTKKSGQTQPIKWTRSLKKKVS